jgi:phage baseplate assembly protein W
VYDKAVEALNRNDLELDIKHEVLKSLMDILETSQGKSLLRRGITTFSSEFLQSDNKEYQETIRSFMAQYTDCK